MGYKLNKKLIDLVPYEPITGTYNIRLDANESCFNLPDSIKEKIISKIAETDFNRYPDCIAKAPIKAFSELYDVPEELVTGGNGSDELISVISSCFFESGDTIVNVSNDFSMYEFYAQLYELNVETYQKESDLTINAEKLIAFCKEKNAKGLIFSNPCNPTSLGLDRASVKKIVEALDDCLVILDEAYMDFWDQSLLADVCNYDNLLILKTCSKAIGLAAVRFGFAVSNKIVTNALRAAKSPYNNDSIAQTIVAELLAEKDYLKECRDTISENTKQLYHDILAIDSKYGFFEMVYKPCTNFVFIKTDEFEKIFRYMQDNSIAIRKFKGYLRITSGTKAENTRFIEVLSKYYSK